MDESDDDSDDDSDGSFGSTHYEDIMHQNNNNSSNNDNNNDKKKKKNNNHENGGGIESLSQRLSSFRKWLSDHGCIVHPSVCIVNGEATDGTKNAPVLIFENPTQSSHLNNTSQSNS